MTGERFVCRGGLATNRYGGGWHDPWVRLAADAESVVLKPFFWRPIQIRRRDVVNVFVEPYRFGRAPGWSLSADGLNPRPWWLPGWDRGLIHFDDGAPEHLRYGFRAADVPQVFTELARLGWPCDQVPRR